MKFPTKNFIERATSDNSWTLGNDVLYELCEQYPDHGREDANIAKVWLIGRAYSAAIERRSQNLKGKALYKRVAKCLAKSDLDSQLKRLKRMKQRDLSAILTAHKTLVKIFDITSMDKRSLASKYLHFHLPELFYIYDSRVQWAIGPLTKELTRFDGKPICDKQYSKFYHRCDCLKNKINERTGLSLKNRRLDQVLLAWEETHRKGSK